MLPKLLELHFSQLQAEWSISKYNRYSDARKQEYHENLSKIILHLEKENFSTLDDTQITQRYYIISFVFKSLEFLNHSTTSTIPFELVYVLEEALKDWSPTNEYLIVTSLINGINEFSLDYFLTFFDFVYKQIELLCGVKFKQRLVQINLPESTARDYLTNVVLYHELGHFVEKKYEITRVIYIEIISALKKGLKDSEQSILFRYFPYLADKKLAEWLESNYSPNNLFALHISEYFCDLFASQYIKDCANYYLEYITLNNNDYSNTHPSTINRIIFINNYLNNRDDFLVSEYKRIIKNITNIEIAFKGNDFTSQNFENLVPVDVTDVRQLHSLFTYGWKVWLADWNTIKTTADINFDLSSSNVYGIINNLIEKSIGNFIITSEWKTSKIL